MTQFQLSAPAGMGQSADPGDPSSALQALMAQMGAPMPTGTAHPQGHAGEEAWGGGVPAQGVHIYGLSHVPRLLAHTRSTRTQHTQHTHVPLSV